MTLRIVHLLASPFVGGPERQVLGLARHLPAEFETSFLSFAEGGKAEAFLDQEAIGFFHKGQDVETELTEATKSWRLTFTKHPSMIDSRGCILEIKEAHRVS